MAPRYRNRTAAINESGGIRSEWFTVETQDGNAIGGLDSVFDFEDEDVASHVAANLAIESGKPLTVVAYTRKALGTYRAVTKVERVDE